MELLVKSSVYPWNPRERKFSVFQKVLKIILHHFYNPQTFPYNLPPWKLKENLQYPLSFLCLYVFYSFFHVHLYMYVIYPNIDSIIFKNNQNNHC